MSISKEMSRIYMYYHVLIMINKLHCAVVKAGCALDGRMLPDINDQKRCFENEYLPAAGADLCTANGGTLI